MTTPHSTNITYVVSPPNTEIPLITINISAQSPLKLTSTNYLSWKLQFETLFIGYDLIGYIDGSKPCPPTTITTNNTATTNLSHKLWIRQDQLLLNALIGSLFPIIIPFIAQAKTAKEAWTILANTYDKPSYGRIKQVKTKLKNPTKGSQNVTEYLHFVKACANELAILGTPLDPEFLTDKILDGLGNDYKELVHAVQARDTSITFDELHEKLLSFEASAPAITTIVLHLDLIKASVRSVASKDIQPRVNFAANSTSPNPTWLLDSGTSHHVTADLNNLSLHSPYNGIDDVMIGNGTGAILFQGSTKDGVYEWTTPNNLILVFSTAKTTSINWHHRLGNPALPVL
ncbi:Retrovirus-related Pol polyprotein from transposon RE1 [Vitis vinifera]|uniref:Retrovirus-related Pol polyprotein from transposon RE1 n=1 Tax=Vitis vinifera TaxID=29760 RepID=A0A438D329_VITVI|nr:Retrovirus-related Pol polyprotein from transposon RE1 [Vitis vinifera]